MDQKDFARLGYEAVIRKRGISWMKELSKRGVKARQAKRKGKSYQALGNEIGVSRQRIHQKLTGYRTLDVKSRKNYPNLKIGICEKCGKKATMAHHKDGNSRNNERENIMAVCKKCHISEHFASRQTG